MKARKTHSALSVAGSWVCCLLSLYLGLIYKMIIDIAVLPLWVNEKKGGWDNNFEDLGIRAAASVCCARRMNISLFSPSPLRVFPPPAQSSCKC